MKRRYETERQIIIHHGTRPVGSLRELLDESEATGTGSGVPLLVRDATQYIYRYRYTISQINSTEGTH